MPEGNVENAHGPFRTVLLPAAIVTSLAALAFQMHFGRGPERAALAGLYIALVLGFSGIRVVRRRFGRG